MAIFPMELDLWLWTSYEDAARGSGEPKVTTKEMAGLKLSHEETAWIQMLELGYGTYIQNNAVQHFLTLVSQPFPHGSSRDQVPHRQSVHRENCHAWACC